jgi:IS5 family transposase
VEELLAQTINVAVELKLIQPQALKQVVVDSTVQPKAIAHPTDSRLLKTARTKLVQAAKDAGINLKQTFAKEGKALARKAGRYAHARQFKRMRHTILLPRTHRLASDAPESNARPLAWQGLCERPWARLWTRPGASWPRALERKAVDGQPKLYAWHAPEVECISKGKARQPYEFGVKVGIASTLEGNLIVGARAFHGNPYDGHTLAEQLEQTAILMQDAGIEPTTAFVDLGYRGVDAVNPQVRIVHRGKFKRLSRQERRRLKRRQAIEPIIGHLKAEHRMDRCHLKGEIGDRLHAVLCAAGYNIRWLLRMIAKKGITFLRLFLRLRATLTWAAAQLGWQAVIRPTHIQPALIRLSSA